MQEIITKWEGYLLEFIEHGYIVSNPYTMGEYCNHHYGKEIPYKCNGCPVFEAQYMDDIKCSDILAIGEQSIPDCLAVLMFFQQFEEE